MVPSLLKFKQVLRFAKKILFKRANPKSFLINRRDFITAVYGIFWSSWFWIIFVLFVSSEISYYL
jgi:hypothetical protein